jgi:hypothetical protein
MFKDAAKIGPISEDYPFTNNGLMLLVGKMGSGKTHSTLKHLLTVEKLFGEPYYSRIVYAGKTGDDDETYRMFRDQLKTNLTAVKPDELMGFLMRHIKAKKKYYALYKYLISDFKERTDEMNRLIEKHKFKTKEQVAVYAAKKILEKFKTGKFPLRLFIMLDDAASSELIAKKDSPLIEFLKTNTRPYNITVAVCVQTLRDLIPEMRRLVSDIVLFKGLSKRDRETAFETFPVSDDKWTLDTVYNSMKHLGPHAKMILHQSNNSYEVVE